MLLSGGEKELFIPYGDAFQAVVLREGFPESEVPAVAACEAAVIVAATRDLVARPSVGCAGSLILMSICVTPRCQVPTLLRLRPAPRV